MYCPWFWQRTQNVHRSKSGGVTNKEELKVALFFIAQMISATVHAYLHTLMYFAGHVRLVMWPLYGIVHPSASRMSIQHRIKRTIKSRSTQLDGQDFLEGTIDNRLSLKHSNSSGSYCVPLWFTVAASCAPPNLLDVIRQIW